MHDARDADDKRLLDEGDFKELLARYYELIRERCYLRLRSDDAAADAAHEVCIRLLRELRSGKSYPVPWRVVVAMVTDWTLRGFYPPAKLDGALPDDWDPAAPDAFAQWEEYEDLGALFLNLPERQREVLELRYLEGLDHEQIAERLGMKSQRGRPGAPQRPQEAGGEAS
jgi:DNA-directed RNA polymerase specialized sigma24 family protein